MSSCVPAMSREGHPRDAHEGAELPRPLGITAEPEFQEDVGLDEHGDQRATTIQPQYLLVSIARQLLRQSLPFMTRGPG